MTKRTFTQKIKNYMKGLHDDKSHIDISIYDGFSFLLAHVIVISNHVVYHYYVTETDTKALGIDVDFKGLMN